MAFLSSYIKRRFLAFTLGKAAPLVVPPSGGRMRGQRREMVSLALDLFALSLAGIGLAGCATKPSASTSSASPAPPAVTTVVAPAVATPDRAVPDPAPLPVPAITGQEIIVAGQRFPVGTRVVTWLEPDGYNGYRGRPPLERRQAPQLKPEDVVRIAARGWDLPTLQHVVDQFVLHYDAEGLSKACFEVLMKIGLSVHFLLDVDGTIYQTLDLQERAAHATIANSRSIGIEIANIGAYPPNESAALATWYRRDTSGGTVITLPEKIREPGVRTPGFVGRPARPGPIRGTIHGKELVQYDFTPEQYAALAKLTAALGRVFPQISPDIPRDASGAGLMRKLSDVEFANHRGVLAHFHIQENKVDPGPAFQWERFLAETRRQLP